MSVDQPSTDVTSPLGSVLLPKHEVETEEEKARNGGGSSILEANAHEWSIDRYTSVANWSIATKNLYFNPVPHSQRCPATRFPCLVT